MAGKIYAGTSGWAYPSWKPAFYPAKLTSKKFLEYYATRLNSVELNYTFRRFPTAKLLNGWVESTPEQFKFAVKAHQNITHVKRLHEAADFTRDFVGALEPLRDAKKMGPVLFQLPPFLKCDVARLERFLDALPQGLQYAFEFRHESWFSEEVYSLLSKANAALCLAESETLETPDARTADFTYMRLRKGKYPPKARKALAERIAGLVEQGDVFVYVKHEETPDGAFQAEELLAGASPKTSATPT